MTRHRTQPYTVICDHTLPAACPTLGAPLAPPRDVAISLNVSRYPLTLVGVVLLIVVLVAAAVLLNTGEQGQRFTIIVGIIATTITALLALLRTELTAKEAVVVKEAVAAAATEVKEAVSTESGFYRSALSEIKADIAENTVISKQAFTEANNFTERLIEQGRQFDALLGAAIGRLPDESLLVDTHEKVKEVHDVVVADD